MGTTVSRSDIDDRLRTVVDELRRERRRTADELEAFQVFEDQVRSIPAETNTFDDRHPVGAAPISAETTAGLTRVKDAYESTIMSVPHYLEEYDETYTESLIGELSPDIASALTDGTEFHGRCKGAVLSSVSTAQSARESLLEVIDSERESVLKAGDELIPLIEECEELRATSLGQKRFGTLDAYRARLNVMAGNCERISSQRQDSIFDQRRVQRIPSEVPDVTVYFYQALAVDYPIMSIIADVLDTINELRRRVEREMTYCHP